jgi:hypothetical protein
MWNEQEKQQLKELVNDGLSYRQIGIKMGRKNKAVGEMARRLGVRSSFKFKIFDHNRNFFKELNYLNCYYSGTIAADGCIGSNKGSPFLIWGLSAIDRELLENFKEDCGYNGEVREFRNAHGYAGLNSLFARVSIHGIKEWIIDLKNNFNVVPQKTERLPPPNLTDKSLILAYILGYTDGDGSVFANKISGLSISYTSCSTLILTWIKHFTDSLKLPFTGYERERNVFNGKENVSTFCISGVQAVALFEILRSVPVRKLNRKWENLLILEKVKEFKIKYPEIFKSNYLEYLQLSFPINYVDI